jgi:hypothetical protein
MQGDSSTDDSVITATAAPSRGAPSMHEPHTRVAVHAAAHGAWRPVACLAAVVQAGERGGVPDRQCRADGGPRQRPGLAKPAPGEIDQRFQRRTGRRHVERPGTQIEPGMALTPGLTTSTLNVRLLSAHGTSRTLRGAILTVTASPRSSPLSRASRPADAGRSTSTCSSAAVQATPCSTYPSQTIAASTPHARPCSASA